MTQWPRQDAASMNAFYGDPDRNDDGLPDKVWEDKNLVYIEPPYPMVISWKPALPAKRIRCHKLVATSLMHCLTGIRNAYPNRADLTRAGLHLYGGCHVFRLKRGGNSLSIHSWGAAIDLNPEANWYGRRYAEHLGMMPQRVVRIFEAEGWVWGGLWRKADAMHFQAARI